METKRIESKIKKQKIIKPNHKNIQENKKNKFNLIYFVKNFYPFIGVIIFLLFTALSIFIYNDYDFFGQVLSELGVGNSAIYFNTGIIITGLFLMPFYYSMQSKSVTSKIFSFTGIISAIALIGVGVFSLNYQFLHFLFAGIFFIFSAITILINVINKIFIDTKPFLFFQILIIFTIIIYGFFLKIPILQKLSVFLIIIWIIFISFNLNKIKNY
jgi:hypothetical membrane protein